ncbi:MAG: hypothetical protein ABH812_00310 [bacterium]
MLSNLRKHLVQIQKDVSKVHFNISGLIQLRREARKAFDERIKQLVDEYDLIKKIKIPKQSFINWRYLLSAPFIYGMIIPAIIWHISIEIYHQVCFRLYGIPLVDFRKFSIYDRQLLSWLNIWQKINCIYCSYINNLIRYSVEIGGRTERYWCPIKYYRRVNNAHSQYSKFVKPDDPAKLRHQWEELRDFSDLENKK